MTRFVRMGDRGTARARHERASEILLEVRGLAGTARDEAIRAASGDDEALRDLVLDLASHADDSPKGMRTGDLHAAVGSIAGHVSALATARPAFTRIGRYRIVGLLGSGGMGDVHEAEQDRPRRRVAVKVLRSGLASREVVARFEREAQVLGQLQHPGIAQILEAGVADSEPPVMGGVAFIAMELVRGLPLTEHARTANLDTRARLELLARACDAVHHAHVRGFVHRDLKPSNLLVDERGQPKVLDFGVARASSSDLTAATLHTTVGQLIGTIAYMSPEQASGDASKVDARSDVHALGAIASELLAGRLPFEVREVPAVEALRRIREDEPTRVGSLDSKLRGDVETIVAKALEKDPERRYQSAAEMAADLRRHLANEPIHARAPSTTYQLTKFARRNRALVAGVVVAFAALVAGSLLLDRARRREIVQRQAADASARQADDERRAALEQAYLASMTAGIAALEEDNVRAALTRLDAAPQPLRGWEWRHARARLDESTLRFPLPSEGWSRASWSADGRRLGAVRIDWIGRSLVRVFDVATSELVAECPVAAAADVALDPACVPHATAALRLPAGSGELVLRDRATSAPIAVLQRLAGSTAELTFEVVHDRPDLVWAEAPGRLGWSALGSSEWTSVEAPADDDDDLSWERAVDPDGGRVVMSFADEGRAEIRELRTLRLLAAIRQDDSILDVTWTRDGRRVVTAGRGGTVRAFDATTGRLVARTDFDDGVRAIAATEGTIATGHASGLVRLLDPDTLELRGMRRGAVGGVSSLARSPSGDAFASTAANDRALRTWSPSQDDPRVVARHARGVYDVAVVPGRMIVSAATDGTLRWSDARTGEAIASRGCAVPGQNAWLFLAPSPGGTRLAAIGPCADGRLVVLDAVTGEQVGGAFPPANWWFAAWTGEARLVAATAQGLVVAWDVEAWAEIARWQAPPSTGPIQILGGLASSGDGSRVATTVAAPGDRATLVLLDGRDLGRPMRSAEGALGRVEALAWFADGSRIVAGGASGVLEVIEAQPGARAERQVALGSTIYDLAISPDGARVVAALDDGSFAVVSWPEWREVARFRAHGGYVHGIAWLPDGAGIVTGSDDQTVRTWTTWPLGEQLADRVRAEPRRKELEPLVRELRATSASWRACVEEIRADARLASGDDRDLAVQVAARLAAAELR